MSINFSARVAFLPDTVRFGRQKGQCCDAADVRERKGGSDRGRERNAPLLGTGGQVTHIFAILSQEAGSSTKIKRNYAMIYLIQGLNFFAHFRTFMETWFGVVYVRSVSY